MISKNEIKYIQTLYHKKQRNELKLFIAEGPKLVEEVLNSNYVIDKIYATENWINKNKHVFSLVTEDELKKISSLQTPNQVLAIVKMKDEGERIKIENKLSLVLDGIQDPGNFGTIIRIADWFGVENIICSNDCVDFYNSKVIQSTMGSFIRVNVVYKNLEEFLQTTQLPVYGALLNGTDIRKIEKPKHGLIIIGNEGNGIRENILPYINNAISIKKVGLAESLNAAIATGVLLSHLVD